MTLFPLVTNLNISAPHSVHAMMEQIVVLNLRAFKGLPFDWTHQTNAVPLAGSTVAHSW